ncbi:hypothetical protein [Salinispora arenicola]|nr:hypothetical protein [Salinispora arenicola]MCN0151782.1 hypothetical protein [Salinispora arenicola]MCN0180003.1 hypothetical protein [Salinispora arenicola]NIL42530.1 hypothetical protein [Salinispora arenicola]NIL59734.1 hypothetical protein [Salinispora arenicola]NIL64548.1 hypothetical protein [Salinispora arenicola]
MHDVENIPRTQFPAGLPAVQFGVEGNGTLTNERLYRRITEPSNRPRAVAQPGISDQPALPPRDEEEPGYVVHLPIRVAGHAAAIALAGTIATSLSFLGAVDAGETTVSTADDQNNRHRVFCDLPLPDRSRCPQPYEHAGPCGEAAAEQRPSPQPATGP